MFELSVAWKYLLPRRRQLSVSVISLISIFVIALVVWLVILFFSITNGIERHWISKLIAVTAPVRITPTPAYYASYYYQIDGLSAASDYAHQSLGQKRRAPLSDPYDPDSDAEIPPDWPTPLRTPDGQLRDLVKETFAAITGLQTQFPGLRATDYEAAFGNIRLRLIRPDGQGDAHQSYLAQATILGSLDPEQTALPAAILPLRGRDVDNVLNLLGMGTMNSRDDAPIATSELPQADYSGKLKAFFSAVTVTGLRVPDQGWRLPHTLRPRQGTFQVLVVETADRPIQLIIPQQAHMLTDLQELLQRQGEVTVYRGALDIRDGVFTLKDVRSGEARHISPTTPLVIPADTRLQAALDDSSLATAKRAGDLRFRVTLTLQGTLLTDLVPLAGLQLDTFNTQTQFSHSPTTQPPWIHRVGETLVLPAQPSIGDAVLLPKPFLDAGILVGDRGYLSYQSPSVSTIQEQRLPVYVAGFYDPGIIPIGGKFVLVNAAVTSLIRSAYAQEDSAITNGINVSFPDFLQADRVKDAIVQELDKQGLGRYWKVETFRQFEFTKELLQQLRSDKNLSMVIASVIILVACSNIVSMLIILVNDKKREIGILRSMGASARSIALIFGLCGVVMGLVGSLLGAVAAVLTLRHLDRLIGFMEQIQGYEIFNPTFYGNSMPSEVSWEGLLFVFSTTTLISILAGIIPAIKASLLKPAVILRSE